MDNSENILGTSTTRNISIRDDTSNVFHSRDAEEVDCSISKESYLSERSDICWGNELRNFKYKSNFSQVKKGTSLSELLSTFLLTDWGKYIIYNYINCLCHYLIMFLQLKKMKTKSCAPFHLTNVNKIDPEIQCVEKDLLRLNTVCQLIICYYS